MYRDYDTGWMEDAACVETDPDAFFPDRDGSSRPAQAVCYGCAVKENCLEFALRNDHDTGIWGGKTDRERRAIQRRRLSAPLAGAA